jgi:ABC-2 type transport system permease protein
MEEKGYLITSILLTFCAVVAAIALTNKVEVRGNIAFVTKEIATEENVALFSENKYFTVTILEDEPAKSELLFHRYDAIVSVKDGKYEIESIKGDEFKAQLSEALQHPESFVPDTSKERGIGANIIGFMMMFLLMQGILYARLFAQDKEKHMIERVAMSPIAFSEYLLGHTMFIMLLIFVPAFVVVVFAKIVGISIGFTLIQYAGLIGCLALLSTTFALFLNSLFCVVDTANMLGSSIVVLTSMLAGSFYSFAKSNDIFNQILYILPQKDFINFMNAIEKGTVSGNIKLQFIYVMTLSCLFLVFACLKTRRDYVHH